MPKPRIIDGFCCQGGAGMGYHRAGWTVIGIDDKPQPRYPFKFWRREAIEFIRRFGRFVDAIHVSPPCQPFTRAQKLQGNDHPDLIEEMREVLLELGKPYVMENVVGAPLEDPVELCGSMFGLRTYRHRLFEVNWDLEAPEHPEHIAKTAKMGRPVKDGEFMHIVGNFSNVALGREIMEMPWASRDGLREAVPPAYTEYIGRQLIESLTLSDMANACIEHA